MPQINPSVLFLLGLLVVVAVILRRFTRQSRKSRYAAPAQEARQTAARLSPPAELTRWEVQMHELARDLSGQLNTKIAILEQLIREAKQQSSKLESLLRRVDQGFSPVAAPETENARIRPPSSSARMPAQAAVAAGSGQSLAGEERYRQVYALADAGQETDAIARHVGSPVGEIELILSLRDRK